MIISVTQEHIDKSDLSDINDCAVAKALRAAGFRKVVVGGHDLDVDEHKNIPFTYPEFFFTRPLPFTFELEIPA